MVKKKEGRGRKKGSGGQKPTISDPILSPFYIQLEENSFTILKEDETSAYGYFGSLANALKKIVVLKLQLTPKKVFSLQEYITTFENSINKLNQTIKI